MGTTDQSKLMFSIGLSDSLDSSSDDIIPMQSRRKKRSFTRKNRNSRLGPSSPFLKTNYSYGLCTLIKFIFVVLILISMIIGMVVMYSLSKRMDSLHLSISGMQSTNKDLPDDLHSLHSKYKQLEQEATNLKINLNNVIITTSNLTQQTAQFHRLPNDVEELKKLVTDLRTQLGSNDNDSRLSKEQQVNLELRLNSFETKLQIMEQNLSTNNQTLWNKQMEQMITVIQQQIQIVNSTFVKHINSLELALKETRQQFLNFQQNTREITNSTLSNNTSNPQVTQVSTKIMNPQTMIMDETKTMPPSQSSLSSDDDHQPTGTGRIIKKVLSIGENPSNITKQLQQPQQDNIVQHM